jgi:hypothetical protein
MLASAQIYTVAVQTGRVFSAMLHANAAEGNPIRS